MAKLLIDGKQYEAEAGQNLLHVCLSLGLNLPYFCWHPALGSVGACRQCAVKQYRDENDKQGRLVMSCMTPVTEGMVITLEDPDSKEFRATIIESLMTNHPHDCPICDEGGECHLQDMTVMTGHNYRGYRFKKRTFNNQYLGPFINHEMNRCITCYRCVRFYHDYAGGGDLAAFASKNHVYFGRHEDGALESEFSGNLVEVCPTGVFTDKTLKEHYTRKWDLQTAPSVCVHCAQGCNTIPGERYGEIRRILNRYHGEVNGYFLCDRGRFGYSFVNAATRIREPRLRRAKEGALESVTKQALLAELGAAFKDREKVIGIGSPRASLEGNFALKTLVGDSRFFAGVADKEAKLVSLALEILQDGPARSASLKDVERCDAVLVLGEDLTNTSPRLALSLRQLVRNQPMGLAAKAGIPDWHDLAAREIIQDEKGPCFIATAAATRLDDIAAETYHAAPEDLARLGFAVAHALDPEAPRVADLSPDAAALAARIAEALRSAKRPLVVSGTSLGSEAVLEAAANVAWALSKEGQGADLSLVVPECNSLGLALLAEGGIGRALEAVKKGEADTLVILENDLYRRAPKKAVDELLDTAKRVIVVDHTEHATTAKAAALLPAGTFAESDGTLVSNEGRMQRFFQVFVPKGEIQESWRWLRELMLAAGFGERVAGWNSLTDVHHAMLEAQADLAAVTAAAPDPSFRVTGLKIPRQPHRYSGRTAMNAHINIHEQKPPEDPDSPLTFSMEGFLGRAPSPLVPRFWAPGWNSVQALTRFQEEVAGPLRGGDPGVRLIEPTPDARKSYHSHIPAAHQPADGELLLVPLHQIFGSEALSALSPAIEQRTAKAALALSAEDAKRLAVADGDEVEVTICGLPRRLPARVVASLPKGVAGAPVGLPDLPSVVSLPERVRANKAVVR
ncbi:MAG: NADH-quinone oxidoreductase subunit NuoG [Candidatus Omnitrophica bacterium]|nr:NADH-quinone oxidoreductase subunit NuoG [Candidatus Omnitrophota bacterium]